MTWGRLLIILLCLYMAKHIVPVDYYKDIARYIKRHKKCEGLIILGLGTLIANWRYIYIISEKLKGADSRIYLFGIPIIYIVLCILLYTGEKKHITPIEIKKCYYICVLIIDVCIINCVDFKDFHVNNFIGVPDELFISGLISIIVFVAALILDLLILSGAAIKEINFAGATFVKEDIKKNIEENASNVQVLIAKIDAEHEILQRFEEYMKSMEVVEKLQTAFETFNWGEEFKALAQYYCEAQKKQITAECIALGESTNLKKELLIRYDLSHTICERVCRSMAANKSFFIPGGEQFLFVPYETTYCVDKMIIVLRGRQDIFEIEQRFILNIFKRFEDYIIPVIAELPEE